MLLVRLLPKHGVIPNRLGGAGWQPDVVHNPGAARLLVEQFKRFRDTPARFVDGASLRMTTANAARGSHPPPRCVAFIHDSEYFHVIDRR
jgi:hypothetical protein